MTSVQQIHPKNKFQVDHNRSRHRPQEDDCPHYEDCFQSNHNQRDDNRWEDNQMDDYWRDDLYNDYRREDDRQDDDRRNSRNTYDRDYSPRKDRNNRQPYEGA